MTRRLYRSRRERVIAGICGGLGEYWHLDPIVLRLVLVFLVVIFSIHPPAEVPLVLFYLIAWMIVPLEPSDNVIEVFPRLRRSIRDRKIAGVCGGIAERLGVDSTVVRLITVFLCFITGIAPLAICYVVAWLIIPNAPRMD